MNFSRKALTALTLSSVMTFSAVAGATHLPMNTSTTDAAIYMAEEAEMHPAMALVKESTEEMLSVLRANKDQLKSDPAIIYDVLENSILKHFDFPMISQLVLARHWRGASDAQKQRFTHAFRQLMVRRYAAAMQEFSDEDITIDQVHSSREDRAVVETTIRRANGSDISVDYRLYRNKNNEWKIADVVIEGISLIITHRGEYSSAINNAGGLDKFLDRLEDINRKNPIPTSAPAP